MEQAQLFTTLINTARGLEPADLAITNAQIADVFGNQFYNGTIYIKAGHIAAIAAINAQGQLSPQLSALATLDAKGMYAVPGFMDGHVHIETTLLTPEALASAIVPCGTTTLFLDPMEIANVAGKEGLLAFLKNREALPYRIYLQVSSRVPTAPGLETTGGILGLKEVTELLAEPYSVSLGELDPSKIIPPRPEYLAKIAAARKLNKICNGHAIGLNWDELNAYTAGGLADCHESVHYHELASRLRLGLLPLIREGSSERNLEELIRGMLEHNLPTDSAMFCTDDKHVTDIFEEGHINYNVAKAIACGLSPLAAIRMATLNLARHFRLEYELGSITPHRYADLLLLPDLKSMQPKYVFKGGELVAQDGKLLKTLSPSYPEELSHTVHLPELSLQSFQVKSKKMKSATTAAPATSTPTSGSTTGTTQIRLIKLIADQIINTAEAATLSVQGGYIQPDLSQDILYLTVVERHGKNGQIGHGFVQGFGLKSGALASSISHDHHNIVVVGTNPKDMLLAVQELGRIQGGLSLAVNGQVIGSLPLPLAGLMSLNPADQVLHDMNELNALVKNQGCNLAAPYMTLSFISLPTVPELGLTDMGLIDVKLHKIIELEI